VGREHVDCNADDARAQCEDEEVKERRQLARGKRLRPRLFRETDSGLPSCDWPKL
jgi:hypothetical protein